MIRGDKAFVNWQFGVESILFAQQCIKRRVGFSDKNSVQITREKIDVVGEFEILVNRFLTWRFQHPLMGDTSRTFTETLRSWIPPKGVPKKIPFAK